MSMGQKTVLFFRKILAAVMVICLTCSGMSGLGMAERVVAEASDQYGKFYNGGTIQIDGKEEIRIRSGLFSGKTLRSASGTFTCKTLSGTLYGRTIDSSTIKYTSSDTKILEVSDSGAFLTHQLGEATLTVTAQCVTPAANENNSSGGAAQGSGDSQNNYGGTSGSQGNSDDTSGSQSNHSDTTVSEGSYSDPNAGADNTYYNEMPIALRSYGVQGSRKSDVYDDYLWEDEDDEDYDDEDYYDEEDDYEEEEEDEDEQDDSWDYTNDGDGLVLDGNTATYTTKVIVVANAANFKLSKKSATSYYSAQDSYQQPLARFKLVTNYKLGKNDTWESHVDLKMVKGYPNISMSGKTVSISSYGSGTSKVKVVVSGQSVGTFTFKTKQIQCKATSKMLAVGQTFSIKTRNVAAKKVKWKSGNTKVASVSKAGKVRAKKAGSTLITGKIGGARVGMIINVATKTKYNAVAHARSHGDAYGKGVYSNAKRMQNGYFDCSSLVWRAYHANGLNIGSSSYAPTAADMGKSLVSKGKKVGTLTSKNVSKRIFQPGDLLFETGANNRRYMGIYHVEMFAGYEFYGWYSDGPAVGCTWANRQGDYYYGNGTDFLCRP